ncbi:MAG: TIGR04255 family protein [Acetobacteraceae bacterium]
MAADLLPAKLKREPLVDAVFEVRFSPSIPGSNVIPGILFGRLPKPLNLERLPAADIPAFIRDSNPMLHSQPLMRTHWGERFSILIGDTNVALGCKMPYVGWRGDQGFKAHIVQLFGYLAEAGFIQSIERYSLKYTGVIEGKDLAEQIDRIKIDLQLGSYSLMAEPFPFAWKYRKMVFCMLSSWVRQL